MRPREACQSRHQARHITAIFFGRWASETGCIFTVLWESFHCCSSAFVVRDCLQSLPSPARSRRGPFSPWMVLGNWLIRNTFSGLVWHLKYFSWPHRDNCLGTLGFRFISLYLFFLGNNCVIFLLDISLEVNTSKPHPQAKFSQSVSPLSHPLPKDVPGTALCPWKVI